MRSTVGAVYRSERAASDDGAVIQLPAAISLAFLGLVLALAIVLVVRRLNGAFVQPLSGGAIVVAALVVESAIVLYRGVLSRTEYLVLSTPYMRRWSNLLPPRVVFSLIIPGLGALAILASLTLPDAAPGGAIVAWLVLISAESTQWLLCLRPELANGLWSAAFRPRTSSAAEQEQREIPSCLVQQVTRTLEGNRESIHALVRAEIPPNDRLAVVHLSFCPPLTAPPELTAHALDNDQAEIRITQAESFGARMEVRLSSVNKNVQAVIVEVLGSAIAPPVA